MQMQQLEYVIKVAEFGSISKAANHLFLSQPSLTKAIMQVEREYSIHLFTRTPRGMQLTPEGKDFVYYAKNIVVSLHAMNSIFNDNKLSRKSFISIASQQLSFLYDALIETYDGYKDGTYHFNLVEADRRSVAEAVIKGDVNLGFIVRSTSDSKTFLSHTQLKQLESIVIDSDITYACVGPHSPYFQRDSISFEEAEHCHHIILDMEADAKQNLYFNPFKCHYNLDKLIFVNTISACSNFLLHTDMLLYVAKWAVGCFDDAYLHVMPVIPASDKVPSPKNELVMLKRAGEPLSSIEIDFLQHVSTIIGKPIAFALEDDITPPVD